MCYVLLFCPVLALHPRKQSIVAKHGFWHIYLTYIYVCVGVSQNEVSFFPRKATVLEPKKDTSCWDIPRWVCVCVHIYIYVCKTYIFLTCVFFYPVLVCPIPKILYFSFACGLTASSYQKKTVSNQNMLHWKLQYRNKTWRKITKISKKKRLSI